MRSPLVTNDYFFPVTQVVAEPGFPVEKTDINEVDYKIRTGLSRHSDDSNSFQLTLDIETDGKKDIPIAYKVHLVVIGTFTVAESWPDPEKLIEINGASILYSAAREFLITVTSRGPYGALMLPTISFNGTAIKEKESKDDREKEEID